MRRRGRGGEPRGTAPREIERFLTEGDATESFEWDEFVDRVVEAGEYSPVDERGDAVHHVRVVLNVVDDAVAAGMWLRLVG